MNTKTLLLVGLSGLLLGLLTMTAVSRMQDEPEAPPMQVPEPVAEHDWLQQMTGEWESEFELKMGPDSTSTATGTESTRSLGGKWIIAQNTTTIQNQPFTGILTIGYSTKKEQFVATWVDSVSDHLWTYTGTLDKETDTLTLRTKGPCPGMPGDECEYKETIQLKSEDHKVFSSHIRGEDGEWTKMMTAEYRRRN